MPSAYDLHELFNESSYLLAAEVQTAKSQKQQDSYPRLQRCDAQAAPRRLSLEFAAPGEVQLAIWLRADWRDTPSGRGGARGWIARRLAKGSRPKASCGRAMFNLQSPQVEEALPALGKARKLVSDRSYPSWVAHWVEASSFISACQGEVAVKAMYSARLGCSSSWKMSALCTSPALLSAMPKQGAYPRAEDLCRNGEATLATDEQ